MATFLQIFFDIDKNCDEYITVDELIQYTREKNLDEKMVERWQELFMDEKTGLITREKFLDTLGISEKDYHEQRREAINTFEGLLKLGKDVQFIDGDMPIKQQIIVTNEIRYLINKNNADIDWKNVAELLKGFLNKTYGSTWHVIIQSSSFWIAYSHVNGSAFHFELSGKYFSIWKTL